MKYETEDPLDLQAAITELLQQHVHWRTGKQRAELDDVAGEITQLAEKWTLQCFYRMLEMRDVEWRGEREARERARRPPGERSELAERE